MQIKENLKIRKIAGETVVLMQGKSVSDMTRVISLNSTSEWLWENLKGLDFSTEDVATLLLNEFTIGEEQARNDASMWVDKLKGCGAIIE